MSEYFIYFSTSSFVLSFWNFFKLLIESAKSKKNINVIKIININKNIMLI